MHPLSDFIVRQITKQAEISTKVGKDKYKAYFVATTLYQNHKKEVDAALKSLDLGAVISK